MARHKRNKRQNYTITLKAHESIFRSPLSYNGKTIHITINANTPQTIDFISDYTGALFTIDSGVTLTLGNNVTLQGERNNYTSLLQVNSGGTLVMEQGSKIIGNYITSSVQSSTASVSGGAVFVNGGTFTMNDGEICDNHVSGSGGAVYVYGGTFTMNYGVIHDNTASSGGAVYVGSRASPTSTSIFTMSGGEIRGNKVNGGGGGVHVGFGGTFIKQVDGIIYGDLDTSHEEGSNENTSISGKGHAVYINDYGAEEHNDTLDRGATLKSVARGREEHYTVSFNAAGGSPTMQTETVKKEESLGAMPTPNKADYIFIGWYTERDSGGNEFTKTTPVSTDITVYARWMPTLPLEAFAWIASNVEDGGEYTITLSADASMGLQTLSYGGKTVSITLIGDATERTISLDGNGSLFGIGNGVTLTLDENITLEGLNSNTASLVKVNSGGKLVMEPGSKIIDNKSTSGSGGGVNVDGGGEFEMNGGVISGNTANWGGGVNVMDGTFTMNDGVISGNTAKYGGGVICGTTRLR